MTPYDLLSEPIRRYVREQGWEAFRPIQAGAILKIIPSTDNFILASRTASGKTEAAFLPILSKTDFSQKGVAVLYISPLIALINDQFSRMEALCEHLQISVVKWHGEANQSQKDKLVKNPNGLVLITPESLEAMLVHHRGRAKSLFGNLKYAIVDEIHTFLDSARGGQLQSLLARLQQIQTNPPFSVIGLSATLGDYELAKQFTGRPEKTIILLDKTSQPVEASFRFFPLHSAELPLDLLKNLYLQTRYSKALIFPNSKGRVEEIAVKLGKLSALTQGHSNYFSHHASIDKSLREYVEHFAKTNQRAPFCIACTSTLEMGIDLGTVDEVVQIDATFSVASLVQRLGRSGRREGESSRLVVYATDRWSLLQSLACWILHTEESFIEPPAAAHCAYDLLLHQLLSMVKEHSGASLAQLLEWVGGNHTFANIPEADTRAIIQHLHDTQLLEKLGAQYIVSIDGEKITNSRDFYTMFSTETLYKVSTGGKTIGEVPLSADLGVEEHIILAAQMWKIIDINHSQHKIEVIPAHDGKRPTYSSSNANIHPRVREKMLELLYNRQDYPVLDHACIAELNGLRADFITYPIKQSKTQRPLVLKKNKLKLYTFSGTRINRTLSFLLTMNGIPNKLRDANSSLEIQVDLDKFGIFYPRLSQPLPRLEAYLSQLLKDTPALLDFSKWGHLLPETYQVALLKQKYYDFEGAYAFWGAVEWVGSIV